MQKLITFLFLHQFLFIALFCSYANHVYTSTICNKSYTRTYKIHINTKPEQRRNKKIEKTANFWTTAKKKHKYAVAVISNDKTQLIHRQLRKLQHDYPKVKDLHLLNQKHCHLLTVRILSNFQLRIVLFSLSKNGGRKTFTNIVQILSNFFFLTFSEQKKLSLSLSLSHFYFSLLAKH